MKPSGSLLVLLPSARQAHIESIVAALTASFPTDLLLIATPEAAPSNSNASVQFVELPAGKPSWSLTAGDFASAHQVAQKNNARAILVLGPEADNQYYNMISVKLAAGSRFYCCVA